MSLDLGLSPYVDDVELNLVGSHSKACSNVTHARKNIATSKLNLTIGGNCIEQMHYSDAYRHNAPKTATTVSKTTASTSMFDKIYSRR